MNLRNHAYYIFVHYAHQCRYTHYTLFLCLYMEDEEEENNQAINKCFGQIIQVMQVGRNLKTVRMKNDEQYLLDVNAIICIF